MEGVTEILRHSTSANVLTQQSLLNEQNMSAKHGMDVFGPTMLGRLDGAQKETSKCVRCELNPKTNLRFLYLNSIVGG